jgi:hypothetical protein
MKEKPSIWTMCKWCLSMGEIKPEYIMEWKKKHRKSRWLVQNDIMLC